MTITESELTSTLEVLSSEDGKFLKVTGTEDSFLCLDNDSIIALHAE